MVALHLEALFPGLRRAPYAVTSPASPDYNCVAWAAGDETAWWWPDAMGAYYWPVGIPREASLGAFVEAYRSQRYEVCDGPHFEAGYEKIALYADASGNPTHAARQRPDGSWTSKLGGLEDIAHSMLDSLSGTAYGRPVLVSPPAHHRLKRLAGPGPSPRSSGPSFQASTFQPFNRSRA